jgi:ATP-dependent Clp protease ATP-binding subunit ClpX
MAGGEKGKGDFAINKIDQCRYGRKGERDGDGGTGIRGKVPTAKELFEKVRQEVVGLDPQIRVLASRIALHAARAEILRASTDDCAVGQMVVVLVGSSGAGKSFVASRLAAHCGLGFCQYDSTVLTSQGYVGADLDEPYRLLVNSVGGDAKEASRGIILFDEFDKKSTRYGRDVCTQSIQQELLGKLQTASPFVIGGKRSSDILPFLFDGRRTGYFLAGVFSGLDEVIRKKAGRSGIGFASEGGSRRHVYVQDALRDFGYLDELVNRVSCVVRLPDPTVSNLEQAIAGTIEDGFSQILLTKGIALHLGDSAVRLIARYAAGTKTFYRGARQVLGVIAEELMFDPKPTAYLIGKADVRRAIERLSSGIVQPDDGGGAGRPVERNGLASPDADQDATPESELAGG